MSWVHAGLWSDNLASQFGGQYTNGPVTVYFHGTTTPAVLYTDRTKATTKPNPTTTDELGNLYIYAEPGLYDLVTPASGTTPAITIAIAPDQADLTGSGSVGVTSFNTRSGAVTAQPGDYTAGQVGADPAGSSAAALATAEAYTDTAVAGRVPTTRTVGTTAPLAGGGALSGNLTLTVADATGAAKGVVQLAGDLAGTAAAPTVPGLAGKAPTASPTFTGTLTSSGRVVNALQDLGNSGAGPVTIDASTGNRFKVVATAAFVLNAPSNPPGSGTQSLIVSIVQDATGGRAWTLAAGIIPPAAGAPTPSSGANKEDLLGLYWNGARWLVAAFSAGY